MAIRYIVECEYLSRDIDNQDFSEGRERIQVMLSEGELLAGAPRLGRSGRREAVYAVPEAVKVVEVIHEYPFIVSSVYMKGFTATEEAARDLERRLVEPVRGKVRSRVLKEETESTPLPRA